MWLEGCWIPRYCKLTPSQSLVPHAASWRAYCYQKKEIMRRFLLPLPEDNLSSVRNGPWNRQLFANTAPVIYLSNSRPYRPSLEANQRWCEASGIIKGKGIRWRATKSALGILSSIFINKRKGVWYTCGSPSTENDANEFKPGQF